MFSFRDVHLLPVMAADPSLGKLLSSYKRSPSVGVWGWRKYINRAVFIWSCWGIEGFTCIVNYFRIIYWLEDIIPCEQETFRLLSWLCCFDFHQEAPIFFHTEPKYMPRSFPFPWTSGPFLIHFWWTHHLFRPPALPRVSTNAASLGTPHQQRL